MTENREKLAAIAISGLLDVAKQAMPDTFFKTDRRVVIAREWLVTYSGDKGDTYA
jgi:hypothetical protein